MADDDKKFYGGLAALLIVIIIAFFIRQCNERARRGVDGIIVATAKKEEEEAPPVPPAAVKADVAESKETGNPRCPLKPYPYCPKEKIDNVYIVKSCGPSSKILRKLIDEGKLTGYDDPKIIDCGANPSVCAAAGVRSYPTVACNGKTTMYEGFCD